MTITGGRRPLRWFGRRQVLLLAGVLLFIGVSLFVGVGRIGEAILAVDPVWFVAMLGTMAAALAIRAAKWRVALGAGKQALALFFMAKGVGDWSPGRIGEFSPLLLKQHRDRRLGAWIVFDRILESAVTVLLGLLGLALLGWLAWGTAAVLAGVGGLAGAGSLWWLGRGAAPATPGADATWSQRLAALGGMLRGEVAALGRKLPWAVPVTLLGKAVDLLSVWLLFRSFGVTLEVPLIMTTRCARALLASLPLTADQTGLPHATELGILHEVTGVPGAVLWATLMTEVLAYSVLFWSLFGVVMMRYRRGEISS